MTLNGRALAVVSAGSVLVWSGIRGWSVLATLGDAITGVRPSEAVSFPLQIAGSNGNATAGTIGASSGATGIAGIALQYQGHPYVFGSAPGIDGSRPWDCSSFVNFVVGIKAGRAIPGYKPGTYRGNVHGPPTGVWAAWSGMATVHRSDVQAGDILLWLGHMGIAISNTQMISALNPRLKTIISTIDKGVGRGPLVRIGRL